ncbi:MAG: hypothetical protein RLO81_12465 [Fulvivirga sp.]|uniref:hypothetical protein n=1 Tax=Fulvivirga sp. TaxID=1931237 RepID=UPI0032EAAB45
MSRLLYLLFILVVICVSCNEESDPEPAGEKLSKVKGDYIYTVTQGNNQTASYGQYLSNDIKIVVRDLRGKIVSKYLEFELLDETGSINYSYNYADTITFSWKLGCNLSNQVLTITDPSLCGVSQDGCIEAQIFEINATATKTVSTGWYQSCQPILGEDYYYIADILTNDASIIIITGEGGIYSSTNPFSDSWSYYSFRSYIDYNDFKMLNNGELFYRDNYDYGLINANYSGWKSITSPFSNSYTEFDMVVGGDGKYYVVSEYETQVYSSSDGQTWSLAFDIESDSYYYSEAQGISGHGDYIYIITSNNEVVKYNIDTSAKTVYSFPNGAWGTYENLGGFYIEVVDNKLFLLKKYHYGVTEINLSTNTTVSYSSIYANKLNFSNGDLYAIGNIDEIYKWNSSFEMKQYPQFEYNYYITQVNIFKGNPIAIDDSGRLIYYKN